MQEIIVFLSNIKEFKYNYELSEINSFIKSVPEYNKLKKERNWLRELRVNIDSRDE